MILEGIRATGVVRFYDVSGKLLCSTNTVLSLGKEWIAQRCTGQEASLVTHMAVGTGTSAATLQDTALVSEIARAPLAQAGAVNPFNKTVIRYEAFFVEGVGVGPLTEAGLFTAAVGGVCVARTVFPVKNKGADDIFAVVWEITIN